MPDLELLPLTATPEQESAVVQYVKERYESDKRRDLPFKYDMLIDWQNMNGVLPRNWPFYWGIFEPETSITANDTIENFMGTVLAKESFFDLRGVTGQNEVQVELMREAAKFNLRRARAKQKFFYWFQDCDVFGNGLLGIDIEPRWRKETVQTPIMDPHGWGVQMGTQKVQQDRLETWASMYNISRWDFFPYGGYGYNDIQDMPRCTVRRWLPLEAVKAIGKYKQWKNLDRLKGNYTLNRNSLLVSGPDSSIEDIWQRLQLAGYDTTTEQSEDFGCTKLCEVFIYYEAPPGQSGCRAYAVVCEDQLLTCRGNDYEHAKKPLADVKWNPISSDLWQCTGVAKAIRPYQDQINIRAAQKADRLQLDIDPMRIVSESAGIKPLTLLNKWPGSIIPATGNIGPEGIRTLDFPQSRGQFDDDQDRASQGIQRASRITNVSKGIADTNTGRGQDTARGIQALTSATGRAVAFKLLWAEQVGVNPALMLFAQTMQQVLTPDTVIHITEANEILKKAGMKGEIFHLHPDDIAGEWEFYAVGASQSIEDAEWASTALQFFQAAAQVPKVASRIDWLEVFKQVGDRALRRPVNTFLMSDEQMQEESQLPKPLPKEMLPKYKDTAPDVQRQIEVRAGLQPSQVGGTSQPEKQIIDHVGKAVTASLKQPKYLPKREPVTADK